MHKLAHLEGEAWTEYIYSAKYQLPESMKSRQSIVVGVPHGDPTVFKRLVESLAPPFHLLYVLHTPRGEGSPGRYQSPAIEIAEFRFFLYQYAEYLSCDARFDLWAHSPAEEATVVWDRHNQIIAYGPLGRYEFVLQGIGFTQGHTEIPVPHKHFYHYEFDQQAAGVLNAFNWLYTPLRAEDEQ